MEAKQHIEELQFKERRLHSVQSEYDCIEYALSGARIFFRDEHKAVQNKYSGDTESAENVHGDDAGAAQPTPSGAGATPSAAPSAAPVAAAPPTVTTSAPPPPTGTAPPPAAVPSAATTVEVNTPSGDPIAATPVAIPPAYKRYDMLRKMGMPDAQLGMKMQAEGFDPAVLGITMDSTALAVVE
jgi:hypothetical protein